MDFNTNVFSVFICYCISLKGHKALQNISYLSASLLEQSESLKMACVVGFCWSCFFFHFFQLAVNLSTVRKQCFIFLAFLFSILFVCLWFASMCGV